MSGQLAKLRASQAEEDCSVVDAPRRSLGDFSAGETKEYARMPLRGSACKPFSNTGDHRGMWDRKKQEVVRPQVVRFDCSPERCQVSLRVGEGEQMVDQIIDGDIHHSGWRFDYGRRGKRRRKGWLGRARDENVRYQTQRTCRLLVAQELVVVMAPLIGQIERHDDEFAASRCRRPTHEALKPSADHADKPPVTCFSIHA